MIVLFSFIQQQVFDLHPSQCPSTLFVSLFHTPSISEFDSLHCTFIYLALCDSQLKAIIHCMNQCTSVTIFMWLLFLPPSLFLSHGAPSSELVLLVTSVEASSY